MQAYATAQLSPLESESCLAPVPSTKPASSPGVNGVDTAQPAVGSSPIAVLSSLIVDGLTERELGVLARRLLPHLRQPSDLGVECTQAPYTVASLAAKLGVSHKAIRCAIARHELSAVKRGARWIISAEAVREWATPSEARPRPGYKRLATASKAAGTSLRSVLCTDAGRGGGR